MKGIISGVDNGTGAVIESVTSVDDSTEYGLSERSPIADEEIGSIGVPVSKEGPTSGDTSSNSDLEDEGETPTGRVGGTDLAVEPIHKEAEAFVGHPPPKAEAKGPKGGYLGGDTYSG